MPTEETPDNPQTEGQTIPPEEQIIPSGGGPILGQEAAQEVHEQGGGEPPTEMGAAAEQAKSLAQQNPNPIALAGAFIAGIVIGRMVSRRGRG